MRARSRLSHNCGSGRVLASTALAVILACPLYAAAQEKAQQKLASTFTERYPAQQAFDRAPLAAATPAEGQPAASAPAEPAAAAELKLSRAVLTYARHVQAGRFSYTRVSRNIELPQVLPEPAAILASVSDAADPAKALDAFSPAHEDYAKLKAALAELRAKAG